MELLDDFKNTFSDKYKFKSDIPLGTGAYGAVFSGFDNDRDIDVAVKIYHDGIVPFGSERGWVLTSKIINPQISSTFTIETFTSRDGKECKAVVSRLIPGKSLNQMFDWANELPIESRLAVADDLVSSFLPSLLKILELSHSLGFGHGDLHAGNIMATLTDINGKFEFTASLIDFDNSSLENDVYCSNEKEKIDKDCRSFSWAQGIGPNIVLDWKWADQVSNIFTSYDTIRDFRISFEVIIKYVALIDNKIATIEKTSSLFKSLLPYIFNKFSPSATIESLRAIAVIAETNVEFESSLSSFLRKLRNSEFLEPELIFIKNGQLKNSLYKDFLD